MADTQQFITSSGIHAHYEKNHIDTTSLNHITQRLDNEKGMMLSSGIEYPGRYNRWELGFVNPPLEIIAFKGKVGFKALNKRGMIILKLLKPIFLNRQELTTTIDTEDYLELEIHYVDTVFSEEYRSRQPSVFTPLRLINDEFSQLKDNMLGLFGAFAYDLIFEFEPINLTRSLDDIKLYHLFFVDHAYAIDKQKEQSFELKLELNRDNLNTQNSDTQSFELLALQEGDFKALSDITVSMSDEAFAQLVKNAKQEMQKGNIFEVVYGRNFSAKVGGRPSDAFTKMKAMNPSPYEFFCQLGDEQIIGTSPEMFVRAEGKSIESCPISGTIKRGSNAMEDEKQIRTLLNSYKDEVELTMCTDVDRNDKARICEPGSIELISRRTIERYQGLFHTVDHVKGVLKPEFTGLDGFLSHMWAVTLTGAPKRRAIELIEKNELSDRKWFGASVGCLGFNGDINSAISIRTIHIKDGKAYYQAGATLVWDSVPLDEAEETRIKATTFYRLLGQHHINSKPTFHKRDFSHLKAIMIDHEDSFVHMLGSYFSQFGVKLTTYRASRITAAQIIDEKPDLVIYSPGPGQPADFHMKRIIDPLSDVGIPQFGVCLGLQGIFEAFGGKLTFLDDPKHGKSWKLNHNGGGIFDGIEENTEVAAYHSIIADPDATPDMIEVTAINEHGHIMAIQHKNKPISAVQFHPESILTLHNDSGLKLVQNVLISVDDYRKQKR
ncbi:MAG: anthranilate synthase component I [Francisellaceae bacterium]